MTPLSRCGRVVEMKHPEEQLSSLFLLLVTPRKRGWYRRLQTGCICVSEDLWVGKANPLCSFSSSCSWHSLLGHSWPSDVLQAATCLWARAGKHHLIIDAALARDVYLSSPSCNSPGP